MQATDTFLSTFAAKEQKRFKLKAGVFLFLIQQDRILLLRRYQTGIQDGLYVVPMGGLEGNETATSAVIREAAEEANIRIKAADLKMCHLMHRFHSMPEGLSFEQLDIFFCTDRYEGVIENLEPHKCDELKFYPLDQLPEKTAPFIQHAIQCTLDGESFSEFGWNELRRLTQKLL